jgi:hypothetical protein
MSNIRLYAAPSYLSSLEAGVQGQDEGLKPRYSYLVPSSQMCPGLNYGPLTFQQAVDDDDDDIDFRLFGPPEGY